MHYFPLLPLPQNLSFLYRLGVLLSLLLEGHFGATRAQGEETCRQNTDCDKAEYCQKSRGDCNGEGRCQERPVLCGAELGPVCGCDRHAYGNLCFAASAGINVAHEGSCEAKPSKSP